MIQRIKNTQDRPARLPKPCTYCMSIGHSAFTCPKKPRKPLKAKKRMSSVGRVGRKLLDQRARYLTAFPSPHYCYYCIYMGFEEVLQEEEVQVEHFLTKNNHPELRFDWSNLVKSCAEHNRLKGGKDGPEFLQVLDGIRRS